MLLLLPPPPPPPPPHQLTAVFVRTVATVVYAVTHRLLADTFPLWALPLETEALPVD